MGSKLHMCCHEAGHIVVALIYGATVTAVRFDSEGNAWTSVKHKQDLSTKKPVACGGYAAEKVLFDIGKLVDAQGIPLSPSAFERQAMHNARRDKYPSYLTQPANASGIYPGAPFQPSADKT